MFLRRLPASPWIFERNFLTASNRPWSKPSLWENAPWSHSSASTWTAAASGHDAKRAQQRHDRTAVKEISPRFDDQEALGLKNRSKLRAMSGVFSQSNKELKDSIASGKIDPMQHMKHTIQTPLRDADVEIIRALIAGEWERVCAVPRQQRKSMVRTGFARLILLHLFKAEPSVWGRLMSIDTDSMVHLCYFALFDKLEDFILDWLNVDLGQDTFSTKFYFRNDLLRNLVNAHLMKDENSSADDAIRCLFKVDAMAHSAKCLPRWQNKDSGLRKLTLWPATVALCSELGSGRVDKTDPQLFDEFLAFFERYSAQKRAADHNGLAHKYNMAALRLSHPTSPDHLPALAVWRELDVALQHASAEEVRRWIPVRPDRQRDFCFRVWQLAIKKGQKEDASTMDDLSQKLYGSRSSNHRPNEGRRRNREATPNDAAEPRSV